MGIVCYLKQAFLASQTNGFVLFLLLFDVAMVFATAGRYLFPEILYSFGF